jgi:hypothetical protein
MLPMRGAVVIAMCIVVVTGCARAVKPEAAAPKVPLTPFADDPVSFVVSVPHFPPGEVAIVRVCVAADRTIASANVMESSGDARFDGMALMWARQIKLRSIPGDGSPVLACGQVRVEIRLPSEPRVISGSDISLG